jgi:hypothetical protein
MEKTANYEICKPSARYFDDHPGGPGLAGFVGEMLDNIDDALSSGGRLKTITVEISSDQLLAMKAAPVVLIAAVSGVAPMPLVASLQYKPVSADYALGDATSLYIGSAVNPISVTNVLPPIPADILAGVGGPGNTLALCAGSQVLTTAQSWFDNQSLVLTHNGTGELTLGDGTLVVTLSLFMAAL